MDRSVGVGVCHISRHCQWLQNADQYGAVFYINIIIGGAFAFVLCFLPETLPRVVISKAVKRRGSVDPNAVEIALGSSRLSVARELKFVTTMALKIMVTEPIVISLGL